MVRTANISRTMSIGLATVLAAIGLVLAAGGSASAATPLGVHPATYYDG